MTQTMDAKITEEELDRVELLLEDYPDAKPTYETLKRYISVIREQQAEIKRLKEDKRRLHVICDERAARASDYFRAYEVLENTLKSIYVYTSSPTAQEAAGNALSEAQRIKEGKDGEQG